MEIPIPNKFKKLWDVWDIRCCILLSLFLQAFLVSFASLRQRSKRTLLIFFVWSAYLLADWVAAVAIGIITQSQGNDCDPRSWQNEDLFAFWSSFLLLHLGGPDNITSFSLEDNEFWLRHLFGLILQVLAAAYSIYLTLPSNKLWLPTMLVFVVGTVKYAERTYALYLASLDRFGTAVLPEPEPGPDYEESVLQLSTQTTPNLNPMQPDLDEVVAKLGEDVKKLDDDTKLLQVSHMLFQCFKRLIVGFFVSYRDRQICRKIFLDIDQKCAFKLMEFELSFMYHVLHTKAIVVCRRAGYIIRFLGFTFILVAACVFIVLVNGKKIVLANKYIEIALTYSLLVGAIVLEFVSIIKLIFSDWTLISPWGGDTRWKKFVKDIILKRRRWAESVSQYNMISYCIDEHNIRLVYKLSGYVNATAIVDTLKVIWHSSSKNVHKNLHKFIFNELKDKSKDHGENPRDAREACLQKGESALLRSSTRSYIQLKWSIGEFQYTESILLWHLATELCYHQENQTSNSTTTTTDRPVNDNEEICKLVSDYMFYLLVMQTTMMSPVLGNWYKVFQDTCAEAKRFFDKHKIPNHSKACEKMISIKAKFRPAAVKGIKSKSVFFDACILAQQLRRLEDRWDVMAKLWVEFMCYAAINCRANIHAQQTSRGGELLTITWLLMYHFGLGTQFSEQEEQAGTKMVSVK
ncbi:uncharacterized protein LOC21386747 [Morus notabilis]|uniref:uncharacterized protein LOC21386747 n=1 Tax=Morus notabilis TaxID=981085 RepID=UPI000CED49BF|nr:uncharacterized protein LOC21386747 [Morus notabilis]